ncbi:MAG: EAL domain-containing protein [Ignavibacteriales bacterium]
MPAADIFSIVFFVSFAVYIFLGIYILSLNSDKTLNRVFFLLCLSLSIWAFCFSIANSAPDHAMAYFWRRASTLGWATMYGFLLHFILILTERSRFLENKWIYPLLYLPGAVVFFVFGLSPTLAVHQYNLLYTVGGWVNILINNGWDLLFNIYYASFLIVGILLIWDWGRHSLDQDKKQQATMFITACLVSGILGTMTEIIVNKYMSFHVPQLGPVITLLPIAVIFYFIRKHGLMGAEDADISEPGQILSGGDLEKFYQRISTMFILGSMLNFLSFYYFYSAPLHDVLPLSTILFLYGILLNAIKLLPKKAHMRENAFIVLISASIPLLSWQYIEYASLTVWAAPFIFLIMSTIFNKRRIIFWLGVVIILTQIYVWVRMPIANVQIDASDHLARLGIFAIAIWMAYYVNKVYIKRLEENEVQIRFQKVLSQISADFVNVAETNLGEKIQRILKLSGELFELDRTYLFSFTEKLDSYEWCNIGIEPALSCFPDLKGEDLPWYLTTGRSGHMIHVPDLDYLPPEADKQKELLKNLGFRSLLSIPVIIRDNTLGFLCFVSMKQTKVWRQDHQEWLRILANILTDALVKVEAEREITYMAYYDALTGLPNRTLFKNRLEQSIELARRTEKLIGVFFIDLDAFKAVNDTMGHDVGDEILREVGNRLFRCLRKQDTVSRFGGDEYLIKVTQISSAQDIIKIAENIMAVFSQPITVKGQEFFITASVGIAVFPYDGEDADVLMKNADMAMYASKEKGKNQYTLCSVNMKEDVLKKMQLTNSLYRALERNELELYYQPQISVSTHEIVGAEALIRWKHAELGMISPGVFIPLAEQTGLINSIGEWVLHTACHQIKEWQAMGLPSLRIAVNLSVEQFRDPNLISIISGTLVETGLEAKYLELEITESTAVKESSYIIDLLNKLKGLGVTIALDDFGTEYSSLSRLKNLPVDRIKIDMQFVHGISEGNKDEAIAKTIIQLAKNLKLKVIAEGVETEPQVEFFAEQLCDEIQGYYYYKPMPADELEALLLAQIKTKKPK